MLLHTASAQACATDALGVIFSFLPLHEVAACAAACRRWSSAIAAATVVVARQQITVPAVRTLRALAESPMRRFVGEIDLSSSKLVTADRVESLWAAFSHLTALTCTIDWRMLTPETTLFFPVTLRSLDVTLDGLDQQLPLDVLLSRAVACPLLHRLRVALPVNDRGRPPVGTIERLLVLRDTITDLELNVKDNTAWESDHIVVFRSLPHLTRLHVSTNDWSAEELAMLTAEPVTLTHLRSLKLQYTMNAVVFAAISRLPSFSELGVFSLPDPGLLAQLPRLETLSLCHNDAQPAVEVAHALARCTSITDLTLETIGGDEHGLGSLLHEFLPTMRRLRSLKLTALPVDIACLDAAPHLAHTLERLDVTRSKPQSLGSLLHVRSLRRLQMLRIPVDLSSEPVALAEEDSEMVFLPSLEHLMLFVQGGGEVTVDLSRFFGRLPELRQAALSKLCGADPGQPQANNSDSIMTLLTRLTSTRSLTLHSALSSADLMRVVASMPHLRELHLFAHDGSLAFLSSSPPLARTLERLTIGRERDLCQIVNSYDLCHLRSLGSLRDLQLNIRLGSSPSPESACESPVQPPPQTVLASLRTLRVTSENQESAGLWPAPRSVLDFALLFGQMPELRSATIKCGRAVEPNSIALALTHCTRLTRLSLTHDGLTDAHLTSALRRSTRLRSLEVESDSLGRLAFLSTPHLAATMETLRLKIHHRRYPRPASLRKLTVPDLQHLRTLTAAHSPPGPVFGSQLARAGRRLRHRLSQLPAAHLALHVLLLCAHPPMIATAMALRSAGRSGPLHCDH